MDLNFPTNGDRGGFNLELGAVFAILWMKDVGYDVVEMVCIAEYENFQNSGDAVYYPI